MKKRLAQLIATSAVCWPLMAAAQVPVAVVENVDGNVGVEFMDYVIAGQVIDLGGNGSIVLSYMKSCVRETITGGTVIALDEESLVQGGKVERDRQRCDAKRMQLDASRATQSAGTVYRGAAETMMAGKVEPMILYGRSPMLQVDDRRSPLLIQRLDRAGQRIELAVTNRLLVAGRFVDLAKAGVSLQSGGRYSVTQGSSVVEFSIAADAAAGATPVVGRLLRFN